MAWRWSVVALLAVVPLAPARSHSWYDPRCCTGRDCHRASRVEALPSGDRIVTADDGMVVAVPADFAAIHASQDSDYHICYYFTWRGEPKPRCLYVPGSS